MRRAGCVLALALATLAGCDTGDGPASPGALAPSPTQASASGLPAEEPRGVAAPAEEEALSSARLVGPPVPPSARAAADGLLTPLDQRVLSCLRQGVAETEATALSSAIRTAAREARISPQDYGAYRGMLSRETAPAAAEALAADLTRAAEERGEGIARAYALADVLHGIAEGVEEGPSRWLDQSLPALTERLEHERREAVEAMTALLDARQATPDVRQRLRLLRERQRRLDGEREQLVLLESLVSGPHRRAGSLELPVTNH